MTARVYQGLGKYRVPGRTQGTFEGFPNIGVLFCGVLVLGVCWDPLLTETTVSMREWIYCVLPL